MPNKKQAARQQSGQQTKPNRRPLIITILAIFAVLVVGLTVGVVCADDDLIHETVYVQIDIADYGTITAELYGEIAPITVTNFVNLANEGFYDNLTFHRVIYGFMMQGGDPWGNGMGGSDKTIKGEFSANGVENNIAHTRGVLSMARSARYDSASSQFFIMHQDAPSLDGLYAAFGRVLTGMEVVDAVCIKTLVVDNNGTVPDMYQPVITSIRQIEKPADAE